MHLYGIPSQEAGMDTRLKLVETEPTCSNFETRYNKQVHIRKEGRSHVNRKEYSYTPSYAFDRLPRHNSYCCKAR